jgi:aldose 1-epimerase
MPSTGTPACAAGSPYGRHRNHTVHKQLFGKMPDGRLIELFTLRNGHLEASFIAYGAAVVSMRAPDRSGRRENVVLGFSDLDGYVQNHRSGAPFFFGSTIGRYANRIANSCLTLDGRQYSLPANNGQHCLHGGPNGFFNVVWDVEPSENALAFHYTSKDGEEGFPGTLKTTVCFSLADGGLQIDYHASTDKPTVINLTNHAYFNLTGDSRASVLAHQLRLFASSFTPVTAQTIPTGEICPVAGTALDFRKSTPIGARLDDPDQQLQLAQGYDHNFVLDGSSPNLKPAAELFDPASGRLLEVLTTEPAIQFYSGNYLNGSSHNHSSAPFSKHTAVCLETQHFPDSPNHPHFPSTVLRPGETFRSTTIYRFSTR